MNDMIEIEEGVEGSLDGELDAAIPRPVGYHILIALPNVGEFFGNGIAKANKTIREETILSMVALVVDVGDMAYKDKEKFPTGAWCKPGDYVMFRPNTGTRFKVAGQEYRILNDDSIQAVVTDPTKVERV